MKCRECGAPLTVDEKAVRRYDVGGLPHVELHGVVVKTCSACGAESIGIPRLDQLHRVLANVLVRQERMLAPVEIRFLRKHMGYQTADFAERMGVSRETVSRWETGGQPMGAVADRLLRLLVITHEPTDSYAVDDLLKDLNDRPAPKRLGSLVMSNRPQGWAPHTRRSLAKA